MAAAPEQLLHRMRPASSGQQHAAAFAALCHRMQLRPTLRPRPCLCRATPIAPPLPTADKIPFSSAPEDDRGLADMHLAMYDDVVVFDQVSAPVRHLSC